MKFWEAPEIHVLASTISNGGVGWAGEHVLCSGLPGDYLAEVAGRSCYWSYGKGRKTNAEYLANIVSSGHGSVLEHPHWTFGLAGISRSLSHELVRHRHLSFSQLSQRFVTTEPEFVRPPAITQGTSQWDCFEAACAMALDSYDVLIGILPDTKAGREAARSVLPNATATRIVVTGNARALRGMLALRGSVHADAEFRRLAVAWTELMKSLAPNMFADFEIKDGCVVTPNPKV
jgi:thymidylate synthase (FAD)